MRPFAVVVIRRSRFDMTLLYSDPVFLKHDTGRHVETAARLRAISSRLEAAGLTERCTPGTFRPLMDEEVEGVHDGAVVRLVKQISTSGGGSIDADTVLSADSYDVGLAAAGACASAVDAVIAGPEKTALCLVRPPGHHATPTHSMGFCLFNNVALAARRARDVHCLNRILVFDWDVHHGNGTQDAFYSDPSVTFMSAHRFGGGFYPGTGSLNETGTGLGLGHTVNVPLRYGLSRPEYRSAVAAALTRAADLCRPELVIVSAGFDAHARDPIGSLGLETEDFVWLTEQTLDVARTHAGGRLVSCLEGGYNVDSLAESVQAHLETLLAATP